MLSYAATALLRCGMVFPIRSPLNSSPTLQSSTIPPVESSNIFCYSGFHLRSLPVFCERSLAACPLSRSCRVWIRYNRTHVDSQALFLFFLLALQCGLDFCLIRFPRILPHKAFRNLFRAITIALPDVDSDRFKVTGERHFHFLSFRYKHNARFACVSQGAFAPTQIFRLCIFPIANRIRYWQNKLNETRNGVAEMDVALLMLSIWGIASLIIFAE